MEEFVFDFEKQKLTYPLDLKHKKGSKFSKSFQRRQITIDLHNYNRSDAKKTLDKTLEQCPRNRGISLLIITGRGLNSKEEKPVIKIFTQKYLSDKKIHWKIAPPKKGGAGAIIAYL